MFIAQCFDFSQKRTPGKLTVSHSRSLPVSASLAFYNPFFLSLFPS